MNHWDIEELVLRATGMTEDEAEEAISDNVDIDEIVFDKYECSFETFEKIVRDLIKFTPILSSPLSGSSFHAFVDSQQNRAIVKVDLEA